MPNYPHFAWPGLYQLFYYVQSDDGHLHACPSCVNQNRVGKNVKRVDTHVNYEDDNLVCDVCEKKIPPSYES